MRLKNRAKLSIILLIPLFAFVALALYLKPFLPHLRYLIGVNHPTTYLILLQNDTELRANGGFAGSYAKLTLTTQDLKPDIDLTFHDIYVPNGQLDGYVKPPEPIQQAFQHGTWELANADWDPDFPTAATAIRWFFQKGGEIDPDILVTLNLTTIKKILEITGPFSVREYQAEINPTNVYTFLQSQAETDFFPGSTQKKDALTAVGIALKKKFLSLNPIQYLRIARVIKEELDRGNLLLHSQDSSFQSFLDENNYSGRIDPGPFDTYLLVETNLGANKANCCIERSTEHTIYMEDDTYRHRVHLTLTNTSSGHNPNPPFDFSGHYISYLRFYLPPDAWSIDIVPNQSSPSGTVSLPLQLPTITQKFGLTEIGFFHTTAAGTTSTIDLSYRLATGSAVKPYHLTILKQNGLASSPQTITYQGKAINSLLEDTTVLSY